MPSDWLDRWEAAKDDRELPEPDQVPDDYDKREAAFIEALTELTRKYRVSLGSCGCCEGIWVDEWDELDPRGGYQIKYGLRWMNPDGKDVP